MSFDSTNNSYRSLHNPEDGTYVWDGIANVEEFIRIAGEEDLFVILRPGPYVCAERDNVNEIISHLVKYHVILNTLHILL